MVQGPLPIDRPPRDVACFCRSLCTFVKSSKEFLEQATHQPALDSPGYLRGLSDSPFRVCDTCTDDCLPPYLYALSSSDLQGEEIIFPCYLLLYLKVNPVFSISMKQKRRRGLRHKEMDIGNYSENILLIQIWSLWALMRSLGWYKLRPWKVLRYSLWQSAFIQK